MEFRVQSIQKCFLCFTSFLSIVLFSNNCLEARTVLFTIIEYYLYDCLRWLREFCCANLFYGFYVRRSSLVLLQSRPMQNRLESNNYWCLYAINVCECVWGCSSVCVCVTCKLRLVLSNFTSHCYSRCIRCVQVCACLLLFMCMHVCVCALGNCFIFIVRICHVYQSVKGPRQFNLHLFFVKTNIKTLRKRWRW